MSTFQKRVLALAVAAAIMPGFLGCGVEDGDSADSSLVGNEITSVVAVDGEFVHTTTYKFHELEPHDGLEAVALLPHLHIVDDLRSGARTEHTQLLAGIEHVSSFLQEHWDGHVGGHLDAGANSHEFMRYLRDSGISPRDFLQEYERAKVEGMTIGQFVSALDSVSRILPTSSPDHFLNFLHHIDKGAKEFLAATKDCYPTFDDYLRAMESQKLDFDALLERYNDSGEEVCSAVMPAQSSSAQVGNGMAKLRAQRQGLLSSANDVLLITQRKWNCIDPLEPDKPDCGGVSAVLNKDDPNPYAYLDGRQAHGRGARFSVECPVSKKTKGKYNVHAQPVVLHYSSHSLYGGRYIKGIRFEVSDIGNDHHCTIDADVHLQELANAGSTSEPDAIVKVEFDLFSGKGTKHETKAQCTWTVQATSGFVGSPECSKNTTLDPSK